jgi:hypothetical protein
MKKLKGKIEEIQKYRQKVPIQISLEALIAAANSELTKSLNIVVSSPGENETIEEPETEPETEQQIVKETPKEPLPPIDMLLGGNVYIPEQQIEFSIKNADTFVELSIGEGKTNANVKSYLITKTGDDEEVITEIPINATYSDSDKSKFLEKVTGKLREKYDDIKNGYESIYIHITCSDTKTHELKSIYLTI